MKKLLNSYNLGDMTLRYEVDEWNHVGFMLLPAGMEPAEGDERRALEPLAQLHLMGDNFPNGYGCGQTLSNTESTNRMTLYSHERVGDAIVTVIRDDFGRSVEHRVVWHEGLTALRITTTFINASEPGDISVAPTTLELLSGVNFGGITPFTQGEATETLFLHRARSVWSAEGRMTREAIEDLQLEPSWTRHALRVEKFGSVGSFPVRKYFPFAAVEDAQNGVTWAVQLACPHSWEIELRRRDDGLALMAAGADEEFGQWHRHIAPGESFSAPECYITVVKGDCDLAAQRLQSIHLENWCAADKPLPVIFNEYCTTWGNPSHENLVKIADSLASHDVDYMVIDSGWYGREGANWSDCIGDWEPNEKVLFPLGMKATADYIRSKGMIPGLWFELETCAHKANVSKNKNMLLHRNGTVLDTNGRYFLDMRSDEVQDYLGEKVIGLLKRCGFDYIKVDYNDSIGMGCDGAESLGEGLRENMEGTQKFFRRMKQEMPQLIIENCASGGHRLEPSMLAISDISSFSDAHENAEIPVIAANVQRLMLPGQSQIWAVLRSRDSAKRLNYSLVNTLLGVMCLSGDIATLSPEQWSMVDEAIAFYRSVEGIIRRGISEITQNLSPSWRRLRGWQVVNRKGFDGGRLVIFHRFGGDCAERLTAEVGEMSIEGVLCDGEHDIKLENGLLSVCMPEEFDAVAVHLK